MIEINLYIESSIKNSGYTAIKFNSPPTSNATENEIKHTQNILELLRKYSKNLNGIEIQDN